MTYTLPQDVSILLTEGHMHKYGTNFATSVSPATRCLRTGRCVSRISGTSPRESGVTNVMCSSQSIFYPVQEVNSPVLGMTGGFGGF